MAYCGPTQRSPVRDCRYVAWRARYCTVNYRADRPRLAGFFLDNSRLGTAISRRVRSVMRSSGVRLRAGFAFMERNLAIWRRVDSTRREAHQRFLALKLTQS